MLSFSLHFLSLSQSAEGLQKTKEASFPTNEVWYNWHVHYDNFSVMVTGVASEEKQTILE